MTYSKSALVTRLSDCSRSRSIAMMMLLACANVLAWLWAWTIFRGNPALLGAAMLAYGLGLRHALDADHIAVIDNATRKMMEGGRRPVTLGMFFSLGHSAVVFLLTLGVVSATATFASFLEPVRAFFSIVGATLSLVFLVAIAGFNLVTLLALWRAIRRNGDGETPATAHDPVAGGFMTRVLAPLSRCINRNWHMFFVGFLFGLSFETASEISLLSLSVSEMTNGLSPSTVLAFPVLFAAGMSLLDAADGAMMIGVYGWALSRPGRRIMYNFVITTLSVVVALFIACIGIAGLLGEERSEGMPATSMINIDMTSLGCGVVLTFAAVWLIAVAASRFDRCFLPKSPHTALLSVRRPSFGIGVKKMNMLATIIVPTRK